MVDWQSCQNASASQMMRQHFSKRVPAILMGKARACIFLKPTIRMRRSADSSNNGMEQTSLLGEHRATGRLAAGGVSARAAMLLHCLQYVKRFSAALLLNRLHH